MFKEMKAGFAKFFGKRWIPIIIVMLISLVFLYYSSSKTGSLDRMTTGNQPQHAPVPEYPTTTNPGADPTHSLSTDNNHTGSGSHAMQPVANPGDLLPTDHNSQWSNLNPGVGSNVAMPDILQAGYHIGLDTIGQTLKNANQQLRSDPIIPKADIGPWNISTYEPDYGRVPLEIGSSSK
jgi:hypothetical protein